MQILVVLEAYKQSRCFVRDLDEMGCVPVSHRFRQRHQGGPVIDRVDRTKHARDQMEDIADVDVDIFRRVVINIADTRNRRFHAEFGEQLLDCELAQFRASNTIAVGEQPMDIERLSAQRQEDAA